MSSPNTWMTKTSSVHCHTYAHINCPDTDYDFGDHEIGYEMSGKIGQTTPNFHKRMREGELLPFTRWEQYFFRWDSTPVERKFRDPNNGCYNHAWDWPYGSVRAGVPDLEWAIEIADQYASAAEYYVQASAAKIYSSGWDALTFLAEFKDTYRMFFQLGSRVERLLTRRTNLKEYLKSKNDIDEIADEYIGARYGWRTLMYDIEDFNKSLKRLNEKARTRYKQRTGTSFTSSDSYLFAENDTFLSVPVSTWNKWECRISVRGNVVADIEPPVFQINPLTTAWEVTKLSFVLDWFLNVGQALEALSFVACAVNYTAAAGIHIECTGSSDMTTIGGIDGYVIDIGPEGSAEWSFEYTRRIPTSIPLSPLVTFNLDVWKGLDLLALIRQRLR